MSRSLIFIIYNTLFFFFVPLAFPAWVIKMWKRGGYGTGLLQRLAIYKKPIEEEPKQVLYVHAVSVGEVLIALKLLKQWMKQYPEEHAVLAATTATGHEVARAEASEKLRVIYSPLDFPFVVRSVLRRFQPRQAILIESEIWPNFMKVAQQMSIPVSIANARLSSRSEARYQKFASFAKPVFGMLSAVYTQNEEDSERFIRLGIDEKKVHTVGSLKFDPDGGSLPEKRGEFDDLITQFGENQKVILAASTHAGEEKLIAQAYLNANIDNGLLIIVPRHAERRADVVSDLESLGMTVYLRTKPRQITANKPACLIIDTTGELRDWTAHADIAIIGKSFLADGGQNPVEAILAGVPVICGAHMGNFEPLMSHLRGEDAIMTVPAEPDQISELASSIKKLIENDSVSSDMTGKARARLNNHQGAVQRTIKLLHVDA